MPAKNKSTKKSTAVIPLEALAATANKEHAAAEKAALTALEHASNSGQALVEAKQNIGHGGFTKWLKTNFNGSHRTANNYMMLAENSQRVANFGKVSVREALQKLQGVAALEMKIKRVEKLGDLDVYVRNGKKDDPPKEAKAPIDEPEAGTLEVMEPDEAKAPTAETPKKRLPSAKVNVARNIWLLAKSQLDKITKDDISREPVLSEVIKYAQNRLSREGKAKTPPAAQTDLQQQLTTRWEAFMEDIAVADYEKVRQFLRDKLEGGLDR